MKQFLHLLFIFSFIGIYVGNSQNIIYQEIKKLSTSNSIKFAKIDALLAKNFAEGNFKDLEIVASKYTNWLLGKKLFSKAAEINQIAINHHSGDAAKLQKRYFKGGQLTFKDDNFPESIRYFKKAVDILATNELAGRAYIELGRNYHALGDYYMAISYFEAAEKILLELNSFEQLTRGYLNSFATYRELETPVSLKKLYQNLTIGDSLITSKNLTLNKKYLIKRAIGKYHFIDSKNRDTVQGLVALEGALSYALEMKDSVKIASTYSDMGILFDVSNLTKSDAYYKKSLSFNRKKNKNGVAVVYANLGKNVAKKGSYRRAEEYLKTALETMIGTSLDFKNILDSEKQKLLAEHSTNHNFWKIMAYLAETKTLEYQTNNNLTVLEDALFYYKFTDQIFDYYTENVSGFSSKLQWRKDASQHYGRALKACFYAQDSEMAFYYMEKNKALLLSEAIDKQRNNASFGLPKEVYRTEIALKSSIRTLEKLANTKENNFDILQEILQKKERLSKYWDSISNIYPSYIPLRSTKLLALDQVKKKLSTNEIVVEYHLSEDDGTGVYSNTENGFVLFIKKDTTLFAEIKNQEQLLQQLKNLVSSVKQPFKTQKDIDNFQKLSFNTYNALFPSEEIRSMLPGRDLIIVPDGILSSLPFDILVTNKLTNSFLLEDTKIHYLYSNSFHQNNKKSIANNPTFLGMAPEKFNDSTLPSLHYSKDEIESIDNYYNGTSLVNEEASKENFLKELPNHSIIHLSTHADAQNTKSPWIAFTDEKVSLDELYLTHCNASLVVLSGCNTTLGEHAVGEGIMSLARGFFHAGAQSVMSTLWSIDDKSTAHITQEFYGNLKNGQTKSEALRNAKLNYLKTHNLSETSPYYWASFVLIGDNAPIKTTASIWPFILAGVLGALILLAIGIRKKSKR